MVSFSRIRLGDRSAQYLPVSSSKGSRNSSSIRPCAIADSWTDRWHKSSWKQADGSAGEFKLTAGKWYGDEEADKGIQTGPDSKFFATYAELSKVVDNTGKDLVLQVRERHCIEASADAFGTLHLRPQFPDPDTSFFCSSPSSMSKVLTAVVAISRRCRPAGEPPPLHSPAHAQVANYQKQQHESFAGQLPIPTHQATDYAN